MKTKFSLTIDGRETMLGSDCLQNWGQVKCAYKRNDYSGVVRTFSSAFEFVGKAYDLVLDEYLKHETSGDCVVTIYTMGNDWGWVKRFDAPLDFSSFKRNGRVISINSLDNGVAAVLNSNTSTKYEMEIGTDIAVSDKFVFDRIPMTESVTYAFTQGVSAEDGSLLISFDSPQSAPIWLGSIGSEVSVGGMIYWNDDQEDTADGYMIKAVKDCGVKLSFNCRFAALYQGDSETLPNIALRLKVGDAEHFLGYVGYSWRYVGEYSSLAELKADFPCMSHHDGWLQDYHGRLLATINGVLWKYEYQSDGSDPEYPDGLGGFWNRHAEESLDDYRESEVSKELTLNLTAGQRVKIEAVGKLVNLAVFSSSFEFRWVSRGEVCGIDALKPIDVLESLLTKMCDGHYNVYADISDHDPRIARTRILAAESIREIPNARLYSTFNDFCDWMSAVFGYTYYIGENIPRKFQGTTIEAQGMISTPYPQTDTPYTGVPSVEKIFYNTALKKFVLSDNGYWYTWEGSHEYNDPSTGKPWSDRIYRIGGALYFFEAGELKPYNYSEENALKDYCTVHFVHRSELFDSDAPAREIDYANDISHSVNASDIYSSVEIGYAKQEYDNINGRDEFNLTNTYTTGSTSGDKKLSLVSKYRADSYGIEFAVQKRGKSTTDTTTDNSVFFVLCDFENGMCHPDRSMEIEHSLNYDVFNGGFSPMACVRANAGYIGVQADSLVLKFASSVGNSDVVIDGEPMSGDITLDDRLYRPDEIEFTTNDLDEPIAVNTLVKVTGDGLTYTGFINEVELMYARQQPVKYKLIVKDIEQCS